MMMNEMVMFVSAPQSKCDHDIVGGVVEVFVLGDAEEDQQVEDQHQGGEGGVASHLHKGRAQYPVWQKKKKVGRPTIIHYSQLWKNRRIDENRDR